MELQADRQETESRGITRILTGSGNSFTPPTPDTTPCTPEVLCPRAEDRSTEQVLDRVAADFVKQLDTGSARHALVYGAAWQQCDIDFSAIDHRWTNAGVLEQPRVDPAQVVPNEATQWNLHLRDRHDLFTDRKRD